MRRCLSAAGCGPSAWRTSSTREGMRRASKGRERGSRNGAVLSAANEPSPSLGLAQFLRAGDVGVAPARALRRSPSPEQPIGPFADGLAPDGSLDPFSSHVHHPSDPLAGAASPVRVHRVHFYISSISVQGGWGEESLIPRRPDRRCERGSARTEEPAQEGHRASDGPPRGPRGPGSRVAGRANVGRFEYGHAEGHEQDGGDADQRPHGRAL